MDLQNPDIARFRISPFKVPLAIFASAAVLLGLSLTPPAYADEKASPPVGAGSLLFADDFTRTTAHGWGTPSGGGQYAETQPQHASVNGSAGLIALAPGAFNMTTLPRVDTPDALIRGVVSTDTTPAAGNGATVSLALRSDAKATSYQARARFATNGRLALSLTRYDGSFAKETLLTNKIVLKDLPANTRVIVEFSATGSSPVALKARAWVEGTAQPDWQLNAADATPQRITGAGVGSVSSTLSSGTKALLASVDDLEVWSLSEATAPDPTPTPTPPTPPVDPSTPPVDPSTPPVAPTEPPVEPTTPPKPQPADSAGSVPVGSANYAVPSGAKYVMAGGSASGNGSLSTPFKSVQHAVDSSPSGSTLVLRAGMYHETVYIPSGKKLTIQSYPGEKVWFDGSRAVTGFSQSGSTWVAKNWNYKFDSRVSFSKNVDESSRFVDPAYPMAGYPDQVWVNGVPQRQVASASAVVPGTFFVDKAGARLVLGTNPTGKSVTASTLTHAIKVHGQGTVLRGFGVRNYANSLYMMGAVTAEVPNINLENLVITQNATVGLYAWADGHKFNKLTVSENGLMGMGANAANGLRLTNSAILNNNTEQFKWAPASGGFKMTRSEGVLISNNIFAGSTMGLWLDVSNHDVTVTRNTITNNSRSGLIVELSEKVVVADNHITNNGRGLIVYNAGGVDIWNNTLAGNERTLEFLQDKRRQEVPSLASKIPWVVRNVKVNNNVLAYGTGSCPILTQDLSARTMYGNDFGISFGGNLYQRASTSSPSNLACWANGTAGTRSFKNLDLFRAHTKSDAGSAELSGRPALDESLGLRAGIAGTPGLSPRPLPAAVADKAGLTPNITKLGTITAPAK